MDGITFVNQLAKIAEENNLNLSKVEGNGKSGRISKGDLINLMGNIPEPSKRKISHGPEERVKMTRLRATIAKRLKEAQDNAAMLTTFNEVDMQNIMQMRQDYQEDFQKKYSVKLGRLVVNDVRETREKTTNANRVNNPLKCSVTSSATPASFNVPQ